MRHIFPLLLFLLLNIPFVSFSADNEYNYIGRPISAALADFCKRNPDLKISFIYDELDDYIVKEKIRSDNAMEVVKAIVALNPVSVTAYQDEIYIEALQKGKYHFSGRTVEGLTGDPVGFATVMLLNPKDSTTITYSITDEKGNFSIPCDRRNVLARFSSVGYKTLYLNSPDFSMGNVVMDIQSVKLGEVTASADSRRIESDRLVYIPSSREKRAAADGLNLLRFMSIPSIRVSVVGSSVSTLSGEGVALFIDGVRASDEEIKGMRPEDVKKVEVLDYPIDPRFEGVPYAINFIMTKYEYGGYTQLLAQQQLLLMDYGYYSLSSKFSKGKMTYDLFTGLDSYDTKHENNSSVSYYDFGDNEIEKISTTPESHTELRETYMSARVKYATESTIISNQLSIRNNEMPHGFIINNNIYVPDIYPQSESEQIRRRNSLTPSWKGNYQFVLPRSVQLVVTPSAKYSHNTSNTHFSENGIENISNVKENEWSADVWAGLTKEWNKHSLTFSMSGEIRENRLSYTGNNPADVHYRDKSTCVSLRGNLTFGKLRLQPSVSFYYKWISFDNVHYSEPLPAYNMSGSIRFNSKHRVSFSSGMSYWSKEVSYLSPNIVVIDRLNAVKGNPKLKSWIYNAAVLNYTWNASKWLYVSAFSHFNHHTRPMVYVYTPTEINGREMMLRSYEKDGYFQTFSEGVGVTARLFGNSLTLQGQAQVSSYRKGGSLPYSRTVINGNISANYYLGNVYFSGMFEFAEKESNLLERMYDRPCYYLLSAGWSGKGWNLSVRLSNIFRSDFKKGWTYMEYDNYRAATTYYGSAYRRNIWLNATYTFRYGKKLCEENIDRGSSTSSGIVY